ncbi:M23 family metallopeptidase [Parapedobacter koreensis]|uniref:Peptidase family M23 n=1 Tax=Parapedobacter koreensis TaxID=332977 RepID=A0A1H7NXN6_9SPHI|nr:M23 family metallopeptidase [Parapedobacter koreensis]SEL28370.1 Peptidase family M23 [Parapedobacter koreensis]
MNSYCGNIRYISVLLIGLFAACSDQLTGTLFKSQSPHQRYLKQLRDAGLEGSTLYRQWFQASVQSLADPAIITIPHQESAYIARDKPTAIAYTFTARQGERLHADISINSADSVLLFVDLFEAVQATTAAPKHLISADTGAAMLSWDIRRDGQYMLRVQPELLAELSFRLRLTAEASLANPVTPNAKQHIGSVFGDTRDGGSRKHEGIDIFAARYTPVVAAADGIVGRVGDNRLGGKVIWLRPKGRPLNLYYAHLDSQLVTAGQSVNMGDTLGLMGNTGNAQTTPPHLHFGVYGMGGAVDPLPFVRPGKSTPPKIVADTARMGDTLRTTVPLLPSIPRHTPVFVEATYRNGYRVVLPDLSRHFVTQKQLAPLTRLRPMQLVRQHTLYAQPDTLAAKITDLETGGQTHVLAEYQDFLLIESPLRGWIRR